jgi:hypothetical protein
MNNFINRSIWAKTAAEIDDFAQRLVEVLCADEEGNSKPSVRFAVVPDDPQSFDACAHRVTIRFELVHAVFEAPLNAGGDSLVGRYNAFVVDKKGDLSGRDGGFTIFPPKDILLDDKSHLTLTQAPSPYEKGYLRDIIARTVLDVVQASLPKIGNRA